MVDASRRSIDFSAADNVRNKVQFFPGNRNDTTIVLCLPAMGMSARHYHALANALSACGLNVALMDLRGHGNSSIRASRANDYSYAELVELDLPAAIDALEQSFPGHKLVLFGHSLGGQVATLYLSQNPSNAKALILSAACSVFYKGWPWPKNWLILGFSQAASWIAKIVGYFPGRQLKFGGREARGVMHDWAHNARTGRYRLAKSSVDYEAGFKRISLPVLAINYDDDEFAPIAATQELLNKMTSTKTQTMVSVSGEDLGIDRADHFNWLHNPDYVAKTVVHWLKTHV